MLAVLFGAATDHAIGARIGQWIDGHLTAAVGITAAVGGFVVLTIVLLARAYANQVRRNRRLRRLQDATLAQQLNHLAARVDDLRADVRQLAELNDAVVGQVAVIRRGLNLADAPIDLRDEPAPRWRPDPSPDGRSGPGDRSQPVPGGREPALPVSVSPASLAGSGRWSTGRSDRRRVSLALTEARASLNGPFGPARLVETGEPMAWATQQ